MVASNRRRRGVYSMRHAYLLKPCSFQIVSYRHVDTCTPYMYYLHKKFANVRWGGHRTDTGHQEKNLGPGADGSGAAAFSRGSSSFGRARHWVASANPGSALAETQHSKQRLATLTAAFQDRIGDLGRSWTLLKGWFTVGGFFTASPFITQEFCSGFWSGCLKLFVWTKLVKCSML